MENAAATAGAGIEASPHQAPNAPIVEGAFLQNVNNYAAAEKDNGDAYSEKLQEGMGENGMGEEELHYDEEMRHSANEVEAMDAEVAKLQEMTADAKTHEDDHGVCATGTAPDDGEEGDDDADDELTRRSVYVGNVDYGCTPQEVQEHFNRCGKIFRVTIMVDRFTGHPKGFAYIEFADAAAANNALMLSNTTLRGRQIKVMPKRKNIAGMSRGRGATLGRGRAAPLFFGSMYGMTPPFAGAGAGRGMFIPPRGGIPGYGPRFRGRFQKRPRGGPY